MKYKKIKTKNFKKNSKLHRKKWIKKLKNKMLKDGKAKLKKKKNTTNTQKN